MLIERDDLTNEKILEIYKAAFIEAEMDDDGVVVVTIEGIHLRARVLDERPFFALSAGFGLKDGADRMQALEMANRFNDKLIMVRCSIPEDDEVFAYFDHFTMTEGGISAEEIVRVTQRFARIIRDGITEYDADGLFG